MTHTRMTRRTALTTLAGAAIIGRDAAALDAPKINGRLKQSVSRWCYGGMSLEDLAKHAKAMGLVAIDLLSENEWKPVQDLGLVCSMANGPSTIGDGFNRVENHDRMVKEMERMLPIAKAAGVPNMIVLSGNRRGMSDREGMDNCVKGLKRIMPAAEQVGINICMELLNSKRDHKDYMCDHTAWGVEMVKGVGSPRMKLLYDIYHMQIMEGDVIQTIRDNIQYIGHFHTGGVPGRHEIDDTQELNYATICKAIVKTGFTGYLAHEFIPTRDPMQSLQQAFTLCDV